MLQNGQVVIYVDSVGKEHDALLTAVWGDPEGTPSVNLVYVTEDVDRCDTYGRQILRDTSVVHVSNQVAHGRYWKPKA